MKRIHTQARKSNLFNRGRLKRNQHLNNAKKSKGGLFSNPLGMTSREIINLLMGSRA